jgi:hypothetical protein
MREKAKKTTKTYYKKMYESKETRSQRKEVEGGESATTYFKVSGIRSTLWTVVVYACTRVHD